MPKKSTVIATSALSLALLVGGSTAATALHKDVTLDVDGTVVPAGSFALTVSDVLAAQGITLGDRDLVYPALSDTVTDGETITVQYSKQVTLSVDGSPVSFYTTATTLDDALAEFQLRELGQSKLSVSRSASLPREGLAVSVTTPKDVDVKVAGEQSQVTTTSGTVADLLDERGIVVDSDDVVKPAITTAVTDGLSVVVDQVNVSTTKETKKIAFKTTTKSDSSMYKGTSKVLTAGKAGKAEVYYRVTEVNGEQTDKEQLKRVVLKEPVTAVKAVGTKARPEPSYEGSGGGLNLARSGMWDRIAKCESGGRWHINTGNGYYGGLQFSKASWNANGGRDFAAYPHQASRGEQITVANRYYAKAGLRPWGCRHAA